MTTPGTESNGSGNYGVDPVLYGSSGSSGSRQNSNTSTMPLSNSMPTATHIFESIVSPTSTPMERVMSSETNLENETTGISQTTVAEKPASSEIITETTSTTASEYPRQSITTTTNMPVPMLSSAANETQGTGDTNAYSTSVHSTSDDNAVTNSRDTHAHKTTTAAMSTDPYLTTTAVDWLSEGWNSTAIPMPNIPIAIREQTIFFCD